MSSFFKPLTSLEYPLSQSRSFTNVVPHTTTILTASDGINSILHTWEPTSDLPVIDLLMIPGAAVDHQIFSLPTIRHNAVQHFTAAGYRTHVVVHRIGGVEQVANNWTTFDARLDIKSALQHIRETYGTRSEDFDAQKIYVIAHCMGSVAFACGLLDGTISADWIKGITCSQVFMNPIWATGNKIKIKLPIKLDIAYRHVAGNWFPCEGRRNSDWLPWFMDEALRFYPDKRKELCTNVACHRCTLVFGR